MKKYLVNSQEEFMAIFKDWDALDVEDFLGIEFPYEDGTYQSDNNPDQNEDQDIDTQSGKFKRREYSTLPEEYPCVALVTKEKDFDRLGQFQIEILEFVYLKDFKL